MAQNYFLENLNYSLANEDTKVEIEITRDFKPASILAVSGSGTRALSLLGESTKNLDLFDLSKVQLDLAKLRYELNRSKTFEDYLVELGYVGNQSNLIYQGKWEKTFQVFSKIAGPILGKKALKSLLESKNIEDQQKIFYSYTFRAKWLALIFLLGNKSVFNALLYKGDFIKKNRSESYFTFYKNRFDFNFKSNLLSHNFFLQLCLFGKIVTKEAYIPEATREVFDNVKQSTAEISFLNLSFDRVVTRGKRYDFVSLSDIASYFRAPLERTYLQDLKGALNQGAVVVLRHYLRKPEGCDYSGYEEITSNYESIIRSECVGVYDIEVLKFKG